MKNFFKKLVLVSCFSGLFSAFMPMVSSAQEVNMQQSVFNEQHTKGINGSFSILFDKPHSYYRATAGTLETMVPNGIMLYVTNGGPSQLDWSAMLYNQRTGRPIAKNWVKFNHGSNRLMIFFDKTQDIRVGDTIQVEFTNNNFPTGVGSLSIYGHAGIF